MAVLVGAAATVCVLGQASRGPQSGGQVNPQMNTELYGGGVSAAVRYAGVQKSSRALDSEVRHAYWKSGATPSEIRMGYAAMGPMHPGGAMAYIPSQSRSYMPQPSKAPPAPMGAAAYSSSSIRYSTSSAPASAGYVAPQTVSPSLVSRGPMNGGPINGGTVRYGR